MSFILDALNKAEKERRLGKTPTFDTPQLQATTSARNRWPWIVGLVLAINALLAAYLLWSRPEPQAVAVAPLPAQTPATPARVVTAPPPAAAAAPPAAPATTPVTAVRQAAAPRSAPPVATQAPRPAPAATRPEPTVTQPAPRATSRPASSNASPVETSPPPAAPQPARVQARPTPPRARPQPPATPPARAQSPPASDAPLLRNMDYDFQRKVPDITINIHVHDPDASRRFVLINMKKYIEGDTIRGGLVIDTITENGLLLEYNGEQFRILASEH